MFENGGIDNTFGMYRDRQHLFFRVLTANILCCKVLHKNGKLQKQRCLFLLATSTIFSSFLPTKYQLHKLYHKCRSYYEFCYEPYLLGASTWIIGLSHQTQILSPQSDLKEDKQSFGTQIRRGTQELCSSSSFSCMPEYAACEWANEVLYMFSCFYSLFLLLHTAFCSACSVFVIVKKKNYQKLNIGEVKHSI